MGEAGCDSAHRLDPTETLGKSAGGVRGAFRGESRGARDTWRVAGHVTVEGATEGPPAARGAPDGEAATGGEHAGPGDLRGDLPGESRPGSKDPSPIDSSRISSSNGSSA